MSTEARVGLLAVVAVAVFVAVMVYIAGPSAREAGYTLRASFTSADGVFAGTPVTIAGVQVGTVRDVHLAPDNRAEVLMRIRPGVRIAQGATVTIVSSGLLGDRLLAVTPGPADAPPLEPGGVVEGKPGFSIEALYARVDAISAQVTDLISSTNEAVRNVSRLVGDPELAASLRRSLANVERATARLDAAVGSDVTATTHNLRVMSASLVATAESLDRFVSQITDDPTLLRQIKDTVASVRRTSSQVEEMARTARGVVNEEQAKNVRDAIAGAKQVVEEARTLIGRVNTVVGNVDTAIGGFNPPWQRLRLEYEVWYGRGRFRSDFEVFVTQDVATYWIVGLRDLGGRNLLSLQRAALLSPVATYRVGIVDGHLGAGLDYRLDTRLVVGADIYNPLRLSLNVYARYSLDQSWSLTFNARDLLRQPYFGVGVRRRF